MWEKVLKGLTYSIGLYALLPTALARCCHLGVIWRGTRAGGRVAITFDDGPDPRYTPVVLDILKQHNVRACFFVLGEKARAYPELVLRMKREGHEVASHGFRHHIPWLLGPRGIIREVREASRVIEEITGSPPRLYRPPWGLFNLFSLLHSLLFGQQVVLWSFLSWDWSRLCTPESIARKVLSRVHDGSILVFHDSDDTPGAARGASAKMLRALPVILSELEKRGFKVTTLAELNPPRESWWQRLGQRLDHLITRLLKFQHLHYRDGHPTLLSVRLRRYRGRALMLNDGTCIRPGDAIGEIHFHNGVLKELVAARDGPAQAGFAALRVLKELKRSLGELARWAATHQEGVKAVMGITVLHRGAERLGFTLCELPSWLKIPARLYQGWLLAAYHPQGLPRVRLHHRKIVPRMVAMGTRELIRRYLTSEGVNGLKEKIKEG